MQARVQSFILQGIDASPCEVEVDVDERGEDKPPLVVGLPDVAVRESVQRMQSALLSSGYLMPAGRIVINLAPADVRKEGPVYDLPMAVGILVANGVVGRKSAASGAKTGPAMPMDEPLPSADYRRLMFAGELALDGRIRSVRGVIALAALAAARGAAGVVVPAENAAEAAVVPGIEVFGVRTLTEVVGLLNQDLDVQPFPSVRVEELIEGTQADIDFGEVRGQESAKRAMMIAAAGSHNVLMLGPPGTGKTMMARALPGILPPLTPHEALEVTRIYSAAGKLGPIEGNAVSGMGLVTRRPVRAPHHTASSSAVIGGGIIPKPGEISLAHHGVLFLDELPEFPRNVLDTLRQPLEEGSVTISRAHSTVRFPARFMLIAAMNPTPKGTLPDNEYGRREMERYLSRLSGPLIDRVDIHVEVPAVPWKQLSGEAPAHGGGVDSASMRDRVLAARARQHERQGPTPNAHLRGKDLDKLAPLDESARAMLGQAMTELGLSARAYDKIRRVSRTIADLEGVAGVGAAHVAEAIQYRLLDRKM